MTNHEGLTPEAIAFEKISTLFTEFPHLFDSVPQAVKTYPDNTEVVINRYTSVEHGGTEQVFDTFNVNVRNGDQGISFQITQNGLVGVSVNGQMVSLRSHLHPRPGEDLRIRYNNEAEEKKLRTPLRAFREAAESLTHWVTEIDSMNQYAPSPISIVEK